MDGAQTRREAVKRQVLAAQLVLVPVMVLDWSLGEPSWRSLPAAIGVGAVGAFALAFIGWMSLALAGDALRGLEQLLADTGLRIAAVFGLAVAIICQAQFTLWTESFNAREIATWLAAFGLLPALLCGLLAGGMVAWLLRPWRGHRSGSLLGWFTILGALSCIALALYRAYRPDHWVTVHLDLLPLLPLLPGVWLSAIRALPRFPQVSYGRLFVAPAFVLTLIPGAVASDLSNGDGLLARGILGLRSVTDRDGDGFSPYFAGGDCNDHDAEIHPGGFDAPRDGVDQDCDGQDFIPSKPDSKDWFHPLDEGKTWPKNLLLVTVDTLRSDRINWLGGPRATMPATGKSLVEKGTLFTQSYANGVRSQRSIPSMVIGRYPSHLKWGKTGKDAVTVSADNLTLGEILRKGEFTTKAIIMERYFRKQRGLVQGWDFHHARRIRPGFKDWDKPTSEIITSYTLNQLRSLKKTGKRWAVWVHYYDPHIRFRSSRFGKGAVARYDESLAVTDKALGRLLRTINLEDTLVVLGSDHGQGLGTHGHHGHGSQLFEEAIRVPLVFAGKPITGGQRLDSVVQNIDVVPTILNLLRLADSEAVFDGRSLVPALVGLPIKKKPAFVEALPDPHTTDHSWAVIDGHHKLIHDLRKQTMKRYDLEQDPGERHALDPFGGSGPRLQRLLNTHRSQAIWLNKGYYGGRQKGWKAVKAKAATAPRPGPDRIAGPLNVKLGDLMHLKSYRLLDPPRAGGRMRMRINMEVLQDFRQPLSAMLHVEGRMPAGKKIFLNRDQKLRPVPDWKAGDRREVLLSFLIPKATRTGTVTLRMGFFKPGHRKLKAKGTDVDAQGRVPTARFLLR